MNEFDRRWHACVAHAREAAPNPIVMPPAFPGRVVSLWMAEAGPSLSVLWLRMGLRALAGATALLALCVFLESQAAPPHSPFVPHVEDTVAQLFWML